MTRRRVNWIILHCSASDRHEDDNIETITKWHKLRGFKTVGYHYYIRKDGTVEKGRDEEEIGAHVKNHNADSIGICLGGLDKNRFTPAQFDALEVLLIDVLGRHDLHKGDILGHRDLDGTKTCPVFDYEAFLNTRSWS